MTRKTTPTRPSLKRWLVKTVAVTSLTLSTLLFIPAQAQAAIPTGNSTGFTQAVLTTAKSLKGRPYRSGAQGPDAFDCSGYVRYVMSKNHRHLPRVAAAQYKKVRHISHRSIRPGDLVFFHNGSHVYHVGIYAGSGKVWHAPRPGRRVELTKIWTQSWWAGRVV